jgi:DNA-binding MarR family transcriptional regulator
VRIHAFLSQSPVVQTIRMARRMESAVNQLLRGQGVTLFESLVLSAILFEKAGEIQPSRLAETFQTTRGNISHCISSLEAKGLVRRKMDVEDARALRLVLLPAGRRRAVRVAGVLDGMQRRFEDKFGAAKLQGMIAQMSAVEEVCRSLARAADGAEL